MIWECSHESVYVPISPPIRERLIWINDPYTRAFNALVKHFVGELEHFLDGVFERFSSGFPEELTS